MHMNENTGDPKRSKKARSGKPADTDDDNGLKGNEWGLNMSGWIAILLMVLGVLCLALAFDILGFELPSTR